MKKIKIGFMPLYIKLYDDINLSVRSRLDAFYEDLACAFEKEGFDVVGEEFLEDGIPHKPMMYIF